MRIKPQAGLGHDEIEMALVERRPEKGRPERESFLPARLFPGVAVVLEVRTDTNQ